MNYTLDDTGTIIRLVMPHKKLWLEIAFQLVATLILGSLFGLSLRNFTGGVFIETLPLIIAILFSVAWLISCLVSGFDLLWNFCGYEVVLISKNHIIIRHQIFGWGYDKKLSASRIDGVFHSHYKANAFSQVLFRRGLRFFNFIYGAITIGYGKSFWGQFNTFRFGDILTEPEAKEVLTLILQRFPNYKLKLKRSTTSLSARRPD